MKNNRLLNCLLFQQQRLNRMALKKMKGVKDDYLQTALLRWATWYFLCWSVSYSAQFAEFLVNKDKQHTTDAVVGPLEIIWTLSLLLSHLDIGGGGEWNRFLRHEINASSNHQINCIFTIEMTLIVVQFYFCSNLNHIRFIFWNVDVMMTKKRF